MNRPGAILLGLGVLYPVVSFVLLRVATADRFGIPDLGHWVLFSFVFPALVVGAVVQSKLAGARLSWWGVAGFGMRVAFVGWCHHWFITGIWAVI
jgi:hypothetical protein